ncbi:CO dehydrogenase maturation factor [Desulfofundulus australicus DSM 11792]|uniref:CO dehydrogenase maturation factor n=1 Tax=Desulfofundulus australicus DSM 11792 TaxID=1121425 RepID=A0A1M5DAZ3_9FIRM|nr:AAA family ATPase [Desulfofundulus australicus]SHF64136.1 CO dehydrogenase maturation factor [Desulfofundulus australicus DSM 11792]
MKLAISGKGGVGKTTIAAALIKSFAETHKTVYAIDADPDACLATAIGIPETIASGLKPIVEMRDLIRAKTGDGTFFTLNPQVDDVLEDYSYRFNNIRFIRMGGIKKGGSECYCRENTFLNAVVSSLLLDSNEVVVMDMGAGIEHLSRGTAKGVDLMLVVVEPSRNSINTANLVKKLAADLGIRKVRIIGNKIRSPREEEFIKGQFPPEEILGFIEFNHEIWESAMEPNSVAAGNLLAGMRKVREKILREAGDQ